MKIAVTLKIRGGCERDASGKKAGKGPLVQWEKSATLGVSQDQTLIIVETDESSAFKGGVTSINANGKGWDYDVCFTLNALDVHGVCFESDRPE